MTVRTLSVLLGAVALVVAAAGCQKVRKPAFARLVTDPPEAEVTIPDLGLRLFTPCDIPPDVSDKEKITITKPGYLPFSGSLRDIPQVARRTHRLVLEKSGDAPSTREP